MNGNRRVRYNTCMRLPFVKRGDLFDLGPLGCGPVMEVTLSREPGLQSQLVIEGHPIKCNAGYRAHLLIGGAPLDVEIGVWFIWDRGRVVEEDLTWRKGGSYDSWCPLTRITA